MQELTSAAKILSLNTLEKIRQRFALNEIQSPYMTLVNPMNSAPVGMVRLFTGDPIEKIVYVGLSVPPIGLDSHMLFAFTPIGSLVPHFTLDSVQSDSDFAFHLDLIPRVDLGANLQYINATLQPLSAEFEAAKTIEGLTPAHLSPRQCALMSPWMLAYRASKSAFVQKITQSVNAYLEHWFKLLEKGIPAEIISDIDQASLAQRDQLHRQALFNPEVDPVWGKVDSLVGQQASDRIREILKNQVVESGSQ